MQEVQLDSKIRLIDCPGIVFAANNSLQDEGSVALKNAIKVEQLTDYMLATTAILQRASKEQVSLFVYIKYLGKQYRDLN